MMRSITTVATAMTDPVSEARRKLVHQELERESLREQLEAARRDFENSVALIASTEKQLQSTKAEIVQAKAALEREEALAAAAERTVELDLDVERLKEKFLSIAEGKPWFEGTGNNDAILSHQWQAMQFGAVAKRWILGDGVGLGKTREAIGWLDLIDAKKVLIVCEANICPQFAGEVMTLAPHRNLYNIAKAKPFQRNGIKHTASDVRHAQLDEAMSKDQAVIVVNYEIWRTDKLVLEKLLDWEADTLIVDEAHNLKTTSTANFAYIKTLLAMDNICPNCSGHLYGLYDPEYLKKVPSVRKPQPCKSCGWEAGDPTPKRYANKLESLLSTRSIKNVCFTTGTPILNDPLDLYSLLHLCNPILFTTKASFQKSYLINNYHSGKWEFRDGALENLRPFITDIFIARTLEDTGIVLPPQNVHVIPVELNKEEYPLQYRTIRQITETAEIILDSGESMTIMHLMALITRKRQANVWPGGIKVLDTRKESPTYGEVLFDAGTEVNESVKMDEIIANAKKHHSERQIVFSQFKTGLAELETRLSAAGFRVARFDGDTPEDMRLEIKANFDRTKKQEPRWDIVLCNYKTGGTGLNFTSATVTHIMDEEWNPGKRNQAYGRTRRLGQTETTTVYVYRIPRTVDTWMSNTIARKEKIVEGFNEAMTAPDMNESFLDAMRSGEML